jgi:3-dehydroquinate synthase
MPAADKLTVERVLVRARSGSYDALCGQGALDRAHREVQRLGPFTGVFLLSSPRVWKIWGRKLRTFSQGIGVQEIVLFDDREASKHLGTVESICRQLIRCGADRRALLLALGGGVVGDVAGFAAASYLRGVSLVHVPTTVVAQVDSAIGGKTGVNLPEGKNLVGAFYPPRLVLVDPRFLRTLPDREYRSGLYEVIKYGAIVDPALFSLLERDLDKLLRRDPRTLATVISRCIRAKARVVSCDERESGLREILNFGHTLAHALESLTRYRRYLHGEAVAWGMIFCAALSETSSLARSTEVARLVRLILRVGPLPPLPRVSAAELLSAMRADKKSRRGRVRFVLAHKIGKVSVGHEPTNAQVARAWVRLQEDRLLNWPKSLTSSPRWRA